MVTRNDVRITGTTLFYLPVETRVPLKFGTETLTHVTCARVCITVAGKTGRTAVGWGETPLSVQWVWPSTLPYEKRHERIKQFCISLVSAWAGFESSGHPVELGADFQEQVLPPLLAQHNASHSEPMPWLAALVCCSAFDIALHDAYGQLHGVPVYDTYTAEFMSRDLSAYLDTARNGGISFEGKFPADYLDFPRLDSLPVWHLVGGKDPISVSELDGSEPDDGYPVLLRDWIARDGLRCLKVKLRGNDADWDWDRLVRVGELAKKCGVLWLSADFNCTVTEPGYVNVILDRLMAEHPAIYGMLLYVEQPFPYDLEAHRIDVHSVSARKPLFMDESAHDWRLVKLGRELGWSGVALKTCKTQTGALLSLCWAKAHGMTLMVQDLTNPMLAQVPHVLLAAHAGTIMGVESNAMQFYPEASSLEAAVHPGLFRRRNGQLDLSTIQGPGFGYRIDEIRRDLPDPVAVAG
ncbi:MAG: mandelate racemase/muconate lactonizing enzyme family protein [Candidatus Hydrogenedentes bacterium]|nr:mandelate racemase/muconate lactonizing enzyme family protein [Candidatus Hydrogenedentota bacterium]